MQKVEEKVIRGSRISIFLYDMTDGLILSVVNVHFPFSKSLSYNTTPTQKDKGKWYLNQEKRETQHISLSAAYRVSYCPLYWRLMKVYLSWFMKEWPVCVLTELAKVLTLSRVFGRKNSPRPWYSIWIFRSSKTCVSQGGLNEARTLTLSNQHQLGRNPSQQLSLSSVLPPWFSSVDDTLYRISTGYLAFSPWVQLDLHGRRWDRFLHKSECGFSALLAHC